MDNSLLFNVPPGAVADVRIIDTTSRIGNFTVDYLMQPPMPGFEAMPEFPSWSFLVENSEGHRALFDLGVPVDWFDLPPVTLKKFTYWDLNVEKGVDEILVDHGYELESIESIIWRYVPLVSHFCCCL